MRQPVELLLSRMDSHPDEFLIEPKSGTSNKFVTMINQYRRFFTDEEKKAIDEKLSEVNLNRLLERTMTIIFPPQEEEESSVFDSQGYANQMALNKTQILLHQKFMEAELKKQMAQVEEDNDYRKMIERLRLEGYL